MEKKTPSGYKILSTSFCPTASMRLTWVARLLFRSPHLLPNIKVGNLANSQSTARKTNRIHTMHLFANAVHYAFSSLFYQNMWYNLTASGYIAVRSVKHCCKKFTRGKSKTLAVFCTQTLDWSPPSCNWSKGPSLLQLFLRWQSLQVLPCKGVLHQLQLEGN